MTPAQLTDAAVDVLGRDKQSGGRGVLAAAEGCAVDDRGDAQGDDRHAKRPGVDCLAVIAYAAAGDQARVPQLHGGTQPVTAAGGQRVDGDDHRGAKAVRRAADQLQRLHPRAGQHAGGQGRHRRQRAELPGHGTDHVPRDQQVLQRRRPHGIGGHGVVAQAHHQDGTVRWRRQQGAELAAQAEGGPAGQRLLTGQGGAQVDGDIAALGLADGPGARRGMDMDAGDGTAAQQAFGLGDAGAGGKHIPAGGQRLRCFHGQIGTREVHSSGQRSLLNTKYCGFWVAWPVKSLLYKNCRGNCKKVLHFSGKDAKISSCVEVFIFAAQKIQVGEVFGLPNIKSAKKRVLVAETRNARNKANKSALKTAIKKFEAAAVEGNRTEAEGTYKVAVKAIDKAAAKGLLHKNNAAHKKSALTLKLNNIG